MPWQIPKDDLLDILNINDLSDESITELRRVLEEVHEQNDIEEITDHIADSVKTISYDKLSGIMRILDTLYHIREASNVELPLFIDDIIEGVKYSSQNDTNSSNIDYSLLRGKLEILLNIRILKLISKATIIQRDGERLYCESKILSDIRPVFDDDLSATPSGAVITHTLKITYHLGRDRQEFHVILNAEELEALHEVLARAQMKEKTLQEFMKNANLDNLGR
jgi:hypothetical protein